MISEKEFKDPAKKYRVNPMTHGWGDDPQLRMQAYQEYGYGGAVTNVPFEDGFTGNPENLARFASLLDELEKRDMPFWIYDEHGYPSGQGGGLVLEGHPELRAKGFYMHRRIAYEPTHATFLLDDESEKIVWAAKYPLFDTRCDESLVRYADMIPVPFTAEKVSCELQAREVLYVLCVKDAFEGTHSTHNVSSFKHNINVMDKRAVRRFLDLCFEPIARAVPDAYRRAVNVFTDEPSLQVSYVRSYEVWPYALAPWVDGLFEEYEKEYGESMLPQLPLLFEGRENGYAIRVKFYSLVGKLVAEAYSGQLAAWCEEHGCGFSGHYLLEEYIQHHVKQYGDYIRVLRAASYPGIDVLDCFPELYNYNTAKFAQIAVRKNNTNGMMVELCPFNQVERFNEAPLENMLCIVGLLYLGGVRTSHSYFRADFSGWRGNALGEKGGYTDQQQTRSFNEYVGRLGAMLDGLHNQCDTFIYYGLESAQAQMRPVYSSDWFSGDDRTDFTTSELAGAVYERGTDFYYADAEDLRAAAQAAADGGVPVISGMSVRTVLVPTIKVMYQSAADALAELAKCGVQVRFIDALPGWAAETGEPLRADAVLQTATLAEAAQLAVNAALPFSGEATGGTVLRGHFVTPDAQITMLCNKSRTDARLETGLAGAVEIWDPADGSVTAADATQPLTVPAMRTLFAVTRA